MSERDSEKAGVVSEAVEQRAKAMLEGSFAEEAADAGRQAELDHELDEKLASLGEGEGGNVGAVRTLARKAGEIWDRRGELERSQVLLLAAAILYFVAPVDALPDFIPAVGYADDVVALGWVLHRVAGSLGGVGGIGERLSRVKDRALDDATGRLVDKGKVALEEVVDARLDAVVARFEDSATESVDRAVTAVAVGLWGATTAAALSLSMAVLLGGTALVWGTYLAAAAALILAWNAVTAWSYVRAYRELDGDWRRRVRTLVAAHATWRHVAAVAMPVAVILALGVARWSFG